MHQDDIIIANTIAFVKSKHQGESSGHDWWHIYRVWKMAVFLAVRENADKFVAQMAALLHDVADWKLFEGSSEQKSTIVKDWLAKQQVDAKRAKHICHIIKYMSFKGAADITRMRTNEGKVVQDADRLDALGALGIARAFAYGGAKGREMHNPDIKPEIHINFEAYKNSNSTTVNHFHEKLLLLKDRFNTPTAKALAKDRHEYMVRFLEHFDHEWRGIQ